MRRSYKQNGFVFIDWKKGVDAMTVRIFLDPGHGGKDSGAQQGGMREKQLTLAIARRIRTLLAAYRGVSVKLSRSGDTFVSLAARTAAANRWGAALYLAVHINAGGGSGYEDYIYPAAGSATASDQRKIHAAVVKATGFRDRGRKRANFHVLRESRMPAVLTENGFIDNPIDRKKLQSSAFIDKIARGHVAGIAAIFGLQKKSKTSPIFLVRVKAGTLYYYNRPDWSARAGVVRRGEAFTVLKTLTVNGASMYRLKSGNYLTANPQYVEKV
jgi:N-acetylmuramoyl-L-alanine amidase